MCTACAHLVVHEKVTEGINVGGVLELLLSAAKNRRKMIVVPALIKVRLPLSLGLPPFSYFSGKQRVG